MSSNKRPTHETRWTREYASPDRRYIRLESKFLDGTASITLDELEQEWPTWTESERSDFCQAWSCADVPNAENIVRFVVGNGDHLQWHLIALTVASELPTDEAFEILKNWSQCEQGVVPCACYIQALASTADPRVREVLRTCLDRKLKAIDFMDGSNWQNWIANDAIACTKYLLELGECRSEFCDVYERVKKHPSKGTRESAKRWLSRYFEH